MDKHLILKDGNKYYVSEGRATFDPCKALKLGSLDELVMTVPIMKDWNWDYEVYEISGGSLKKVKESEWMKSYRAWKKDNPGDHEELYRGDLLDVFVRITT